MKFGLQLLSCGENFTEVEHVTKNFLKRFLCVSCYHVHYDLQRFLNVLVDVLNLKHYIRYQRVKMLPLKMLICMCNTSSIVITEIYIS